MSFNSHFKPYLNILSITIVGFIIMVAGLIFLGWQFNKEITLLSAQTSKLYQHPFQVNAAARDVRFAITKIEAENLAATLSPKGFDHKAYLEQLNQNEVLLDKSLSIIEANFLGDMEKVREVREGYRNWLKDRAELINLITNERNADAAKFISTKSTPTFEPMHARVNYILTFSSKKAEDLAKQSSELSELFHARLQHLVIGFAFFMLIVGAITAIRVLKSLYQRDKALRKANENIRIAATVFESEQGMIVTDVNNIIIRVNQAFTKITGYSAEDAMGQTPRLLKSGQEDKSFYTAMWKSINNKGYWEGEILNKRKSGEVYPQQLTITSVKDDDGIVTNYVATLSDITERKEIELELTKQARLDYLTGLSNRRHFMEQGQAELLRATRYGKPLSILMLDIDFFKNVNDIYGHQVGDSVLQALSKTCQNTLRQVDIAGRLGGEEFGVILPETSDKEALDVAERLREAIANTEVIIPAGFPIHFNVSIGVTKLDHKDANIDVLLNQADKALYEAKQTGRNKVCIG